MNIPRKSLKVLVVLLIIIDAIIFWYLFQPKKDFKENVVVTNLKEENPESKIPVNFPSVIYVDKDNIVDSYVMEYLDRGVKILGVTYITNKNSEAIYDLYIESLNKAKFYLNQNETNKNEGRIYFTKNTDTLNILINKNTPEENKTTVQLVYTQNK